MELKITGVTLQKCTLRPGESEVVVPRGVRIIEWAAFSSCVNLRRVVLPEGLLEIRRAAFQNCRRLVSINLPERLKAVYESAFAGCSALRSIALPDSVSLLGARAFEDCASLEQIRLPMHIKRIDNMTFRNCKKLQKIYLNDELDEIGLGAFENCTALRQIRFPQLMTDIGERAFRACSELRQVKLPERLERMGGRCFENCTALVSLILPEGIVQMPGLLCKDCLSLEQAVLPASIERNSSYYTEPPFDNCPRLTRLIVRGELFEELRYALRELTDQLIQLYVSSPDAFEDAECFRLHGHSRKLMLLALRTYAGNQDRFSPQTQSRYEAYIMRHIMKLRADIVEHVDVMELICRKDLMRCNCECAIYYIETALEKPAQLSRLLRYVCGKKWLTREKTLELIDRTTAIDQSEATAVLLQYQNEHFPVQSGENDDSLFLPDWDDL